MSIGQLFAKNLVQGGGPEVRNKLTEPSVGQRVICTPKIPHFVHFTCQLPDGRAHCKKPPWEFDKFEVASRYLFEAAFDGPSSKGMSFKRNILELTKVAANFSQSDGGTGPIGQIAHRLPCIDRTGHGDLISLDVAQVYLRHHTVLPIRIDEVTSAQDNGLHPAGGIFALHRKAYSTFSADGVGDCRFRP